MRNFDRGFFNILTSSKYAKSTSPYNDGKAANTYSQSLKKIPTILSIYSLFACFHRGRASPRRATHTQKSLFLLWLQAIQKFATRPNKVTGFTNVMGT